LSSGRFYQRRLDRGVIMCLKFVTGTNSLAPK